MMTQNDVFEHIAVAEKSYELYILQGKSLAIAAKELRVDPSTVYRRANFYLKYLAKIQPEKVAEKRAKRISQLERVINAAWRLHDIAKAPKDAVAALNTINGAMTHIRAIEGLDEAKRVELKEDKNYTFRFVREMPAEIAGRVQVIETQQAGEVLQLGNGQVNIDELLGQESTEDDEMLSVFSESKSEPGEGEKRAADEM